MIPIQIGIEYFIHCRLKFQQLVTLEQSSSSLEAKKSMIPIQIGIEYLGLPRIRSKIIDDFFQQIYIFFKKRCHECIKVRSHNLGLIHYFHIER